MMILAGTHLCDRAEGSMDDPFQEFAKHYDRMVRENPAREEFFRSLFRKHQVGTVLDCACGTGNDLLMVRSFGLQVHGSDISAPMLAEAQKKLKDRGIDAPLKQIDFRELPDHYDLRFDAVLCLTTSLPQLLDEQEIVRALKSMHQVLKPRGLLVLTQGLTDDQLRSQVRFAPAINDPDFSRIMVVDYYDEEYEVNILDLKHTLKERRFDVFSIRYRILLRDDYERLLRQTGFTTIEYYGDWDFMPYDTKGSEHLIVVGYR